MSTTFSGLPNDTNLHTADEIYPNSKSLLQAFPPLPVEQSIYGCYELNAQFQYGFSPDFDKNLLSKHDLPVYEVSNAGSNDRHLMSSATTNAPTSVVESQAIVQRLINSYLNSGLVGLCEDIVNTKQRNEFPNGLVQTANALIKIIDFINSPTYPWQISMKPEELKFDFIKGDEWKKSVVRAFKWHPYLNKFAVVFNNDIVKIYSNNQSQVILKNQNQIDVTCVAWKPYYPSIIAIGCAKCIIIWDTDNLPVSIKPSSSCSFTLSKRYHNDIMDLQWYPKSDFLLSIASKDNQIMIWDVTLKTCVPIKRIGTNGFSLAQFSPDGLNLFTADLSASFRIWNPVNYSSEKWVNLMARCNSSCWSPDSSMLLFSCDGCSLVYSLKFMPNNKQELNVVCDLSNVALENYDDLVSRQQSILNSYSIGGAIYNMVWDPSGQRLAISFKSKLDYLQLSHRNTI